MSSTLKSKEGKVIVDRAKKVLNHPQSESKSFDEIFCKVIKNKQGKNVYLGFKNRTWEDLQSLAKGTKRTKDFQTKKLNYFLSRLKEEEIKLGLLNSNTEKLPIKEILNDKLQIKTCEIFLKELKTIISNLGDKVLYPHNYKDDEDYHYNLLHDFDKWIDEFTLYSEIKNQIYAFENQLSKYNSKPTSRNLDKLKKIRLKIMGIMNEKLTEQGVVGVNGVESLS